MTLNAAMELKTSSLLTDVKFSSWRLRFHGVNNEVPEEESHREVAELEQVEEIAAEPVAEQEAGNVEEVRNATACPICRKNFSNKWNMIRHVRGVHGQEMAQRQRNFLCDQCQKAFMSQSALNKHKLVHSASRNIKCNIEGCPKSYKTVSAANEHKKTAHAAGNKQKCNVCGKLLTRKTNLRRHFSKFHPMIFKCDLCAGIFDRKVTSCPYVADELGRKNSKVRLKSKSFKINSTTPTSYFNSALISSNATMK
jgi:uncharacterized Zn-finger protein